jgi:hypothetical protein
MELKDNLPDLVAIDSDSEVEEVALPSTRQIKS